MSNTAEQTSTTATTKRDKLLLRLESLENLLNQVALTLEDVRGDILDLDQKVDDNHDAIFSTVMDVKIELNDKIDSIEENMSDIASSYADESAQCVAEDLRDEISSLEKRFDEVENTMADVLLLKS